MQNITEDLVIRVLYEERHGEQGSAGQESTGQGSTGQGTEEESSEKPHPAGNIQTENGAAAASSVRVPETSDTAAVEAYVLLLLLGTAGLIFVKRSEK